MHLLQASCPSDPGLRPGATGDRCPCTAFCHGHSSLSTHLLGQPGAELASPHPMFPETTLMGCAEAPAGWGTRGRMYQERDPVSHSMHIPLSQPVADEYALLDMVWLPQLAYSAYLQIWFIYESAPSSPLRTGEPCSDTSVFPLRLSQTLFPELLHNQGSPAPTHEVFNWKALSQKGVGETCASPGLPTSQAPPWSLFRSHTQTHPGTLEQLRPHLLSTQSAMPSS